MNPEFFRWSRNLALISISFFAFSCSLRYNSIQFTKNDDHLMYNVAMKNKSKKFKRNVIFVHTPDTIYQLAGTEFKTPPYYKELSSSITAHDSNYVKVYEYQKEKSKGVIPKKAFSYKNDKPIRQTHIFVDSASVEANSIKIQERNVQEINMYFKRMSIHLYVIIGLGVLTLGAIITFITLLSKSTVFGD